MRKDFWEDLPFLAVAIVLGLAIGWVYLHTDEDAFVVLPLLGATGLLGLVRPRDAWRWALLVGIWLPLGQAAALVTAMPLPYPNNWEGVAAVLAIALGLGVVGAYAGALEAHAAESAEIECRRRLRGRAPPPVRRERGIGRQSSSQNPISGDWSSTRPSSRRQPSA